MQTLSNDRLGKFTASEIHKLFTGGKTRETYIFEKAEEIIKGHSKVFRNKHTDHGHLNEFEAIQVFSEVTGMITEHLEQEFFPINENCGATPDARVVDFTGKALASLDAKCPTATYFAQKMVQVTESKEKYQNVSKEYFYQGQMQMLALNVNEHYLVRYLTSMDIDYDGNKIEYDLPLNVRLFHKKITADKKVQEDIIRLVEDAAKERDAIVKILLQPIV